MGDRRNPQPRTGRLFLRDAVAILPENRRDLVARLHRSVALAQKFDLNLEITLDARFFADRDEAMLAAITEATSAFPGVAYHLHSGGGLNFGDNAHTRELVDYCREQTSGGRLLGLCVHPDLVDDYEPFKDLAGDDFYIGVEVLDESAGGFNTLNSMTDLLSRHSWLGMVLDTAHIAGMTAHGEPALEQYCAMFADRTVEVHLSQTGNLYDASEMGPSFKTDHSLLSLGENVVADSLRSLKTLDSLVMVIEGVIPAGDYGERLLEDELKSFTANLQ